MGNTSDESWATRLADLVAFRAEHGRWPYRTDDPAERSLRSWLSGQRSAFRAERMPGRRRQALLGIGVKLVPEGGRDATAFTDRWDENLAGLEAFRAACGRWPSVASDDPDERRLGRWVNNQRNACQAGRLSGRRRQALLDAGVGFGLRQSQWDARLAECVVFRTDCGRWPSQASDDPAERRLGNWVGKQRSAFRAGKLSGQRRQALLDAGVFFGPGQAVRRSDEYWAARLADLESFLAEHGRWPIWSDDERGQALARWVTRQRAAWRDGSLPDWRRQALAGLGVKLDQNEDYWAECLDGVLRFRAEFGRWPSRSRPGREGQLGTWLHWQRHVWRAGKLSTTRYQALTVAGVELVPTIKVKNAKTPAARTRWAGRLDEVVAFHASRGCWPARTGDVAERRLADWVGNQRSAFRAGRLSEARRRMLVAAGVDLAPGAGWGEKVWRKHLAEVVRFHNRSGRWPSRRGDQAERSMAVWVNNQRQDYRRGRLSAARYEDLVRAGLVPAPAGGRPAGFAAV